MLTIAKFDKYDMINNPMDTTAAITIWFTGCTFRCRNCHNRKLWSKEYGHVYTAESVSKIIIATCNKLNIKSVVFLGGEPLQQDKQELLSLCQLLKKAGLKIWIYTGYNFNDVDKDILKYVYTIKCGKYIDSKKQDGFPSSSNQKVYRSVEFLSKEYISSDDDFVDITKEFRR